MSSRVIILISIVVSLAAAACNCGSGLSCCGDQCYNTEQYSCPTDLITGDPLLCAGQSEACNGSCYDPTQYSCLGGLKEAKRSSQCQTMFSQLKCRTISEDPTQMDANAVAGARSWLCSNYGQYCTSINSGGQYATCNSVEQLSYAMNLYYAAFQSQGTKSYIFTRWIMHSHVR